MGLHSPSGIPPCMQTAAITLIIIIITRFFSKQHARRQGQDIATQGCDPHQPVGPEGHTQAGPSPCCGKNLCPP